MGCKIILYKLRGNKYQSYGVPNCWLGKYNLAGQLDLTWLWSNKEFLCCVISGYLKFTLHYIQTMKCGIMESPAVEVSHSLLP